MPDLRALKLLCRESLLPARGPGSGKKGRFPVAVFGVDLSHGTSFTPTSAPLISTRELLKASAKEIRSGRQEVIQFPSTELKSHPN